MSQGNIVSYLLGAASVLVLFWLIYRLSRYNYIWECDNCDFRISTNSVIAYEYFLENVAKPHIETYH